LTFLVRKKCLSQLYEEGVWVAKSISRLSKDVLRNMKNATSKTPVFNHASNGDLKRIENATAKQYGIDGFSKGMLRIMKNATSVLLLPVISLRVF
jgi:hypothetical protein